MAEYEELIPVNLVTGALGSGKTTLLRTLLAAAELSDTAVLINEFGEIALDHLILERVDETTVLLDNGCICCSLRDDLAESVKRLLGRRQRGAIVPFRRLAIEASGLSDPAPILFTVVGDPVLRHHFRIGVTIATVDALNAGAQRATRGEWTRQVALADKLVLTKGDLAGTAAVDMLKRDVAALNPAAEVRVGPLSPPEASALVRSDPHDEQGRLAEAGEWVAAADRARAGGAASAAKRVAEHDHDIATLSLTIEEPLDWTGFAIWLSMLLHAHGERVLRVKAILNTAGAETPVIVHGVHHMVYPPSHLPSWPSADRRSHLVFIVRDLDIAALRHSLSVFMRIP